MNLSEMHDRVDFWVDKVKAPRYKRATRDAALNVAIDFYIKDRYDNIKNRTSEYSFEIVERVREELNTLLVDEFPLPVTTNFSVEPPDFLYHILTYVEIQGQRSLSVLKGYVENDLSENSFSKPNKKQPIHRRVSNGFKFDAGLYTVSNAFMWYIKYPDVVKFNENAILAGPTVLTIGLDYYVFAGPVTHNGITYNTGDVFTAATTAMTGTGTVNLLTNCNLPKSTHEEVCKIAASVLSGTFEDYQKSQKMNQEALRS